MDGTELKVDNRLNTMTITFPTSPRVVIRWTADQVDDHLRKLGELRSKMKPPHPGISRLVRSLTELQTHHGRLKQTLCWATLSCTSAIRDMAGYISYSQKRTQGNLRPFFKNRWIVRGRDKDGSRVNRVAITRAKRIETAARELAAAIGEASLNISMDWTLGRGSGGARRRKEIGSRPKFTSYTTDTIGRKIAYLREFGFADSRPDD